jgi:hypothetical protein
MTNKNRQKRDDDLLKRLERLEKKANRGSDAAGAAIDNPSDGAAVGLRQTLEGLGYLGDFVHKAGIMARYAWDKVGSPIWSVFKPVANWIGSTYMNRVWRPYAYKNDENSGERIFSKKRAGAVMCLTAAFAMAAVPVATGTLKVGVDAAKMATSTRVETVYLHTANSHGDNTYSVKGCDTLAECSTEDAVYYNVESSTAKHIWSLFNKGSLYVPKRVIGTVAPDANNRCDVTIYGAYYEKAMQQFGIYPELLDISCVRVDAQGNPVGSPVDAAPINSQQVQNVQQQVVNAPAP